MSRFVAEQSYLFGGRVAGQQGGGSSSNTPLPNLILGGEDTVSVGLFVSWLNWADLSHLLERGKCLATSCTGGLGVEEYNDQRLYISPAGSKSGDGPYFKYVFTIDAVRFSVMNKIEPTGDTPNVYVTVGSVALMQADGFSTIWDMIQSKIAVLDGCILRDVLSRCDVCIDLVDQDIEQISQDFFGKKVICRAQKKSFHMQGLKFSGFSAGKEPMIRVYDKVLECSGQEEKWQTMVAKRWRTEPVSAVRVEFQMRRKFLKSAGITTVSDWYRKRSQVVSYLTREWFRMTDDVPDRNNTEKIRVGEFWQLVIDTFESVFGTDDPVKRIRKQAAERQQLMNQAVGCVASAVACKAEVYETLEELQQGLIDEFTQAVKGRRDLWDVYETRLIDYTKDRIYCQPVTQIDDISFYFGDLENACHITARDVSILERGEHECTL